MSKGEQLAEIIKRESVMDTPVAAYRITVEKGRLVITGGAHADAYGPVNIPIHEADMLILAIKMTVGLDEFKGVAA